jgi:hypothetical protein
LDIISNIPNNKKIKIGDRFIGSGEPVFIIAKAGVITMGMRILQKDFLMKR